MLNQTVEASESEEELKLGRVGRDKELVPMCFAFIYEAFSCSYNKDKNTTHCEATGDEQMPSLKYTVEWHDEDCGYFRGDVLELDESGKSTPLATITKTSAGRFLLRAADQQGFPLGVTTFAGVRSVSFTNGECLVTQRERETETLGSASVSLCAM